VRAQQLLQTMLADLVVAKTYDTYGELRQRTGAQSVTLDLGRVVMGAAIELQDQAQRCAVEVDEEARDDLLATELQSQGLSPTQQLPGDRLCRRWLSAKRSGERQLACIDGRVARDTW